MADLKVLKKTACDAIDKLAGPLHELSKDIWSHPELSREEVFAHETLTNFLEKHGFRVDRHYLGLDTAFRATFGEGKPHVAVLCEYDALPDIGHACGHNLIAEVGVASGLGIKAALQAAGVPIGKLTVLGTPDEEAGGGKVDLINKGAFNDIDFAGMCHPTPKTVADASASALCIQTVKVTFKGKASHASAYPWDGINALDAAVLAFNNISCLRQQLKPTWRVHGVISNGGSRPNIIPELTSLEYYVRTPTFGELQKLKDKLTACFNAAGLATGCELNIEWSTKPYKNILPAPQLADLFEKNGREVGIEFCDNPGPAASTDMGNVSHEVPSIHPIFYIGGNAVNHTRGFTDCSGADIAQKYTLDQAKALAMTALDILCTPELLSVINDQFKQAKIADTES